MFDPMTTRKQVSLLDVFARQSHQLHFIPWPIGSEWHCFIFLLGSLIPWPTGSGWHCCISLPGSLINHASSHDQQEVSDTFISLLGSLISHVSSLEQQHVGDTAIFLGQAINHVSSYDQQEVSDTALFLCQAISPIMFHPMTNREWVKLLDFFARQAHQSCFIPWPIGSEWNCFILCWAVSSIMFHPIPNRQWVTLLHVLASKSINHVSSHHQQFVSDTAFCLS